MAIEYKLEYDLLELDPVDGWAQAKINYRRLVNGCHPDRYARRPREREHAQQQFIELTKAFNNLRSFYRENQRMPFERIRQSVADEPVPAEHLRVTPTDETVFQSGILNKRKPLPKVSKTSRVKPFLWAVPALAVILAGFGVFMIIDRNAKLSTIEEAKRVLRETQPSEFIAKSDEISQANRRAVMISGGNNPFK